MTCDGKTMTVEMLPRDSDRFPSLELGSIVASWLAMTEETLEWWASV